MILVQNKKMNILNNIKKASDNEIGKNKSILDGKKNWKNCGKKNRKLKNLKKRKKN